MNSPRNRHGPQTKHIGPVTTTWARSFFHGWTGLSDISAERLDADWWCWCLRIDKNIRTSECTWHETREKREDMIKSRHYCLTVKEPCQCKQEFQTVHRPPVLGGIVCSFKASQETPERRIYLQVVVRCWKCSQILQVKWEPPRPTIPSLLELPISMYHIFHLSLPFASHDPTGFSHETMWIWYNRPIKHASPSIIWWVVCDFSSIATFVSGPSGPALYCVAMYMYNMYVYIFVYIFVIIYIHSEINLI